MQSLPRCSSNGSNGLQRIDQFALVSYIADPLGAYLDELRIGLVPDCKPRAHVTVLPPRPLCGTPESAIAEIERQADEFSSFTIRLGDVAIFEKSDVIYLDIVSGSEQLREMYDAMNSGCSRYRESYEYHPHITVAQNIPHELVKPLFDRARESWKSYPYPKEFPVDVLSFVQNTTVCKWIDLADIPIPVAVRK